MDKGEKLAEYDHSPFDVVCFEVYMANTYIKNKTRLFVKSDSDKQRETRNNCKELKTSAVAETLQHTMPTAG